MTTHFITAEVDMPKTADELHTLIVAELETRGLPLRWAVTDVDLPRQKAIVEAIVTDKTVVEV